MQGPRIGDMARQLHCHSELGRFAPFHVAFGAFSDGEGLRYIGISVSLTFVANWLPGPRDRTMILLS